MATFAKLMENHINNKKGVIALSSVVVLLAIYLTASILAGDFYRISIGVAFVVASIYAVAICSGYSFQERIGLFSAGASNQNIMYMIWIFVLAGIFAYSAKAVGAVDATVQLTLQAVPSAFLPAGIFIAACFISMSIGTSVGTIVALAPVVAGIAQQTGADQAWAVAIAVGGAFFGDNLSFISDTTIAATQSQGCPLRDKFRTNILIVLPAAIITLLIYIFGNTPSGVVEITTNVEWYRALPYLFVIVLALGGMNVLKVLICGIILTDAIGLIIGNSTLSLFEAAGGGLQSMCELILITLLAGGMMNMVRVGGGFELLIRSFTAKISGRIGAEFVIVLLTIITDICTANNTIAIITVGQIANDISKKFTIAGRRVASLMDTASCFAQGLLPYGAQLLMAAGLSGLSPFQIIPYLYYPMLIGGMIFISIIFNFPKTPYIKK